MVEVVCVWRTAVCARMHTGIVSESSPGRCCTTTPLAKRLSGSSHHAPDARGSESVSKKLLNSGGSARGEDVERGEDVGHRGDVLLSGRAFWKYGTRDVGG